MESLRSGYGLHNRPADGTRMRQPGAAGSSSSSSSSRVTTRKGSTVGMDAVPRIASTQSRLPSRVPQPTTTPRQGGRPQAARRPTLDRHTGTAALDSVRYDSHAQGSPVASRSSKSSEGDGRHGGRGALHRKRSTASADTAAAARDAASSSPPPTVPAIDPSYLESRATLDAQLWAASQQPPDLSRSPVIYPELDRYRNFSQQQQQQQQQQQSREPSHERGSGIPHKLSTHDLPPPTPASVSIPFSRSSSQLSASPSTKFSGSPGPSPYSRDTTPTSMSSQSPSQTFSAKFSAPKVRQPTPTSMRPPTVRRRAGSTPTEADAVSADPYGLAPVRESLNSSSSNSTVKDGDRNRKPRRLAAPPPSPPPRTSSQNILGGDDDSTRSMNARLSKSRSDSAGASSTDSRILARNNTAPPGMLTAAPARPSREGTPNINSQLIAPNPVVHSNLSASSLPTERRSESNDRPVHERKMTSASQIPQTRETVISTRTGGRPKPLGIPEPTSSAHSSRTPSPNVSSFRFPFFGRKKSGLEDNPPKATKKEAREKRPPRKGPAAGTGHEGYGRLGAVRRRSGNLNLTRAVPDNSHVSQESITSDDSFFSDRKNPVVIAGGGVVDSRPSLELSRTESEQSLSSLPRPSTEAARSTMWPSPVIPQSGASSRRPSESSDSERPMMKSTLALRRSIHHGKALRGGDTVRVPQPIKTDGVAAPSPMTSFDTSIMSEESHLELQKELSRGRSSAEQQQRQQRQQRPPHPVPKKLTKRERSPRKWNIFGKSHKQQSAAKQEGKASLPVSAAAVSAQPVEKKPVAFYTMMDSSEPEDLAPEATDSIHSVLRSAEVYPEPADLQPAEMRPAPLSINTQPEVAAPSSGETTMSSGRPSRLQHVGRIPKVVSQRQPPQPQPQPPQDPEPKRSFSRPFRDSIQPPSQPADHTDTQPIGKGPNPSNDPADVGGGGSVSNTPALTAKSTPPERSGNEEFLRFSPRKNSNATVGTSSSGSVRYPFDSLVPAVIPGPGDPPAEDEVWDEYDDLLESAAKEPPSATSSRGIPFHLETYQSRLVREEPMESPTLATDRVTSLLSNPTTSSCYSADFTERLRNAFQVHPSPTSSGFGDVQGSPQDDLREGGEPVDDGPLGPLPAAARRSLSPIRERGSASSSSCCSSSSSEDGSSPLSQVNLRVGSMTVSKWLTFGQVLFSDVRHDLAGEEAPGKAADRHSVLVIDGLGNDDWSFYAAETYPAATFYNLSPRAPLPTGPEPTTKSAPSFPLTPANHHQIQYRSHLDKFPFAARSFTCVVYRFAVAAPDSHYRNILSEARRVLKPGGYLELSILDVDLNNMGHRGRRAVRRLKESIHAVNADVNLASTADLIVRLIGRAGFYDVKAARVGVPVATPKPVNGRQHGAEGHGAEGDGKKKPSLSEMMSDDSSAADESITKMVSRVGRWWYTRCYESAAAIADSDGNVMESMWDDGRFLRECHELGTSLKLTVCYGRAPDRVSSA